MVYEDTKRKKDKYVHNYEKYHKMTSRMRNEITKLETNNAELMEEIKVL